MSEKELSSKESRTQKTFIIQFISLGRKYQEERKKESIKKRKYQEERKKVSRRESIKKKERKYQEDSYYNTSPTIRNFCTSPHQLS